MYRKLWISIRAPFILLFENWKNMAPKHTCLPRKGRPPKLTKQARGGLIPDVPKRSKVNHTLKRWALWTSGCKKPLPIQKKMKMFWAHQAYGWNYSSEMRQKFFSLWMPIVSSSLFWILFLICFTTWIVLHLHFGCRVVSYWPCKKLIRLSRVATK